MRTTKASPHECPECQGIGYTAATSDSMLDSNGAPLTRRTRDEEGIAEKTTVRKGSGCPRCLGTGQLLPRMH